jgi:hypothetical protein
VWPTKPFVLRELSNSLATILCRLETFTIADLFFPENYLTCLVGALPISPPLTTVESHTIRPSAQSAPGLSFQIDCHRVVDNEHESVTAPL